MTNLTHFYQSLLTFLDRSQWKDKRHLKTAVNMVMGLVLSEAISLTKWTPSTIGRALLAQSIQRRFSRWLCNPNVKVAQLYAPLLQPVLGEWGKHPFYLALDTSMLWNSYCLIRISIIYRGRALPLAWKVIEHGSSAVAIEVYEEVLKQAASQLPQNLAVILLADRGFADVQLMKLCKRLNWGFRIRIKAPFKVYRNGHLCGSCAELAPKTPGKAVFLHNVELTYQQYGPVHVALAYDKNSYDLWYIVSDKLTGMQTFEEYGLRFDIEENFLDDKSNGFQLESSLIRSASELNRLCFILAVATLYLVTTGTQIVEEGKRRLVDPHWFRGNSYLRIGWKWVKQAIYKSWNLLFSLRLSGGPDPDPSKASHKQYKKSQSRFKGFKCNILNFDAKT